jgi:hypothetical protein
MKKTLLALVLPALLAGCNPLTTTPNPLPPPLRPMNFWCNLSSGARDRRSPHWHRGRNPRRRLDPGSPGRRGYEAEPAVHLHPGGTDRTSQNIVAELKGQSDKVISSVPTMTAPARRRIRRCHRQRAGVAALLAVAEALKGETLPYTVRFAFFGAERTASTAPKPMPPVSTPMPSPSCWPW